MGVDWQSWSWAILLLLLLFLHLLLLLLLLLGSKRQRRLPAADPNITPPAQHGTVVSCEGMRNTDMLTITIGSPN